MSTSQADSINNTDLSLTPNPVSPEIAETLLQAFVRNFGWDTNGKIWRRLLTDPDGRLLVSTSVTQGSSANQPVATVNLANVILLGANASRRLFMVQNLGANPIYLGFGAVVTPATGFQVASGATFIDDHFVGAINAIASVAGNDVRIVEF